MRRRKSVAEQQATVEAPDPVVKLDVLGVQDLRRCRPLLGRDKKIAGLDLLDPDRAEPFAPVVGDSEVARANDLKTGRKVARENRWIGHLNAQAKKRVFLAIRYPVS
jgi:hypothetical protein